MRFRLIDDILEQTETRIVTIKQVSLAEDYLWDHFPGFPVMPGVLMLEALVQSAIELARDSAGSSPGQAARPPAGLVLGSVRALKYGAFVGPGSTLRLEIERKAGDMLDFAGRGLCLAPTGEGESKVAVSGKFTLRAPRPMGQARRPAVQS